MNTYVVVLRILMYTIHLIYSHYNITMPLEQSFNFYITEFHPKLPILSHCRLWHCHSGTAVNTVEFNKGPGQS